MVWLDLQDLAVEGPRRLHEPVLHQVVCDADVLFDGLVGLVRAVVAVTKRVRGRPVVRELREHPLVLADRGVEPPLPQELLRLPEGLGAVDGHASVLGARWRGCASAHRIKQRVEPEGAAVDGRVAMLCNGGKMVRGRVAFVPIEAVARITTGADPASTDRA